MFWICRFLSWLLGHVKILQKFQARRPADDFRMSKVVDSRCLKKCHDRSRRHVNVGTSISLFFSRRSFAFVMRGTMLFGRRSNVITRCHSSRSHFYCLLIIFTDVPFLPLKFYTVVGTMLTYDYTMFGIY